MPLDSLVRKAAVRFATRLNRGPARAIAGEACSDGAHFRTATR